MRIGHRRWRDLSDLLARAYAQPPQSWAAHYNVAERELVCCVFDIQLLKERRKQTDIVRSTYLQNKQSNVFDSALRHELKLPKVPSAANITAGRELY